MRNSADDVESHVARRVDEAMAEGRLRESIVNELTTEGFPLHLYEDRMNALNSQRIRAARQWGIGQVVVGGLLSLVGLGITLTTLLGGGGGYVILYGLILLGVAILGRGLQALFYRG
jgi:hypothetical protein